MIKFRVHYKKEAYNPNKTYFANANRYAACKIFDTIEEARSFATTVNNAQIFTTTGVKVK